MFENIRRFQRFLVESGMARNVLALPAPKTLLIEDHTSKDETGTAVFSQTVVEEEIVLVSRDLFASGHYNVAVAEAFKAVDNYVRDKTGLSSFSGSTLMENVFSSKKPKLVWSERKSISEKNEQDGYMRLYAGAMLGIRNPTTHEFNWVESAEVALELLVFAQHLLRKAKCARPSEGQGI
ncbi:TIGR02391 family protein [Gymnodinialimonas ulvae]|uniref:TIGR02391 family protein n=1 Tax=Gymnodinialimonas ulvae TaxID=3126504 RepID=UPI0030AD2B8F